MSNQKPSIVQKELLQKNGSLRNEIIGYYQKWQTEVAQLDNPSQAEKQLVEKQAEVSLG